MSASSARTKVLRFEVPEEKVQEVKIAIEAIEGCREITPIAEPETHHDVTNTTNPKQIVANVTSWLKKNNVSQLQFAKTILGRGQPTLNAQEGSQKSHFLKMHEFLTDDTLQSNLKAASSRTGKLNRPAHQNRKFF